MRFLLKDHRHIVMMPITLTFPDILKAAHSQILNSATALLIFMDALSKVSPLQPDSLMTREKSGPIKLPS